MKGFGKNCNLKTVRALSIVDVINRKPFFFKTQNVHRVQRWKRVQQTTSKQCTTLYFDKKLFWSFTARINCSSNLKNLANYLPSESNFVFLNHSTFFLQGFRLKFAVGHKGQDSCEDGKTSTEKSSRFLWFSNSSLN